MTKHVKSRDVNFYLTAPAPCPYLPGREERKVFAHLDERDGDAVYGALTHVGFRRSQNIIYRPACEACNACVSVRTRAARFAPSRSQKRVLKRNAHLVRHVRGPNGTQEQFALLDRYLRERHEDGGMAGMDFVEYALMAGDTPVTSQIIEYRADGVGELLAAMIVDVLPDGYSLVYSFFDPDLSKDSLGAYMVLDQIARAQEDGLNYVYLGYWVEGSVKMDYKSKFRPLEALTRQGWTELA